MDSKKRFCIQGVATLLQNANFKGFFTGKIFQGTAKSVCVPGLNCYSCPGAVGACPIGSLQNFLSAKKFRFPYYVVGLLIFFGVLLGRAVCGFLCPFGFLQDLLHKIPFPKKIRSFRGDRLLRKLKYGVL
ncbi:MAG: 4Fe-4S binding protein, partial [Oscillospiraceae bacterium]|nr:4Fe-4S binding protein [Oscillospiraceae bacterium]